MNEFSDNEIKLFSHFGFGDLVRVEGINLNPPALYRMAVEKAFLDSEAYKPNYIAALKQSFKNFNYRKVYRQTKQFEEDLKNLLEEN